MEETDNLGKFYLALEDKNNLKENNYVSVRIKNHDICISHYKGVYSAMSGVCPHMGIPLGDGEIKDGAIICFAHGWRFKPCTCDHSSRLEDFQNNYLSLDNYPLEIRGDKIFIQVIDKEI